MTSSFFSQLLAKFLMSCCCDKPSSGRNQKWRPLETRSCTDVIPLAIFTLFFVGMILLGIFSVLSGAADRLVFGWDSFGNICNHVNHQITNHSKSGLNLLGKKFVFFMDFRDPPKSLKICVEKCPDHNLDTIEEVKEFALKSSSHLCDYDVTPDTYTSMTSSMTGPCPVLPVPRSSSLFARCLPDFLPDFIYFAISQLDYYDVMSRIIADIYVTRSAIIALCFAAFLLSVVMVILIRFWASFVVMIINVVLAIASIGGTGLMWWVWASSEQKVYLQKLNVTLSVGDDSKAFLGYSIAATIGTVILLLLMLVMRKRVGLVVGLFHEAGKCLTEISSIFLQPIWTFLILICFWLAWLIAFGCLATSGDLVLIDKDRGWVDYQTNSMVTYMRWYHLIGLFWITEFILACQQMTIAGAVASWYFARDKKSLRYPVLSSINRLITNHLGSCSFGAFFIVLVSLPRYILTYIYNKCKDSENLLAKFLLKCCICCLWILEKILRYLNYNAYSLVAINGTNFCRSACDAVATILSNPLRVATINSLGTFILFLGKLLVAVITAAICGVFVLRGYPEVHYVAAPIAVVFIFSYLVASCFLTIYGMCIDTLFLCFCEDCRVNDGSLEKQYFMSKTLMAYVKKGSHHLDKLDGKNEEIELMN